MPDPIAPSSGMFAESSHTALTDQHGHPIRLRWSERNMLVAARQRQAYGTVEGALATDLVTVLERLGRMRRAMWTAEDGATITESPSSGVFAESSHEALEERI